MTPKELARLDLQTIDKKLLEFSGKVGEIQDDIILDIVDFFFTLPSSGGNLLYNDKVRKLLLEFEDRIFKILNKSGYATEVNGIISNLGTIEDVKKELSALINPEERKKIFDLNVSDTRKGFAENIATKLNGRPTFGANIIAPIQDIIFESATIGLSIPKAIKRVLAIATSPDVSGGLLNRYATQIARDSVFGFTGAVDQSIGEYIGAKNISYIGDIVRDSRPQCVRWITKFKGFIPADKVKSEIAWAKKNGEGYSSHLPELSEKTFAQVRGGHNCRHRATWTVNPPDGQANKKLKELQQSYEDVSESEIMKLESELTGITKKRYEKTKAIIDAKIKKVNN